MVKINGLAMEAVPQAEFTAGQVGLVTHVAVARFDKVFVGVPFGDQEFFETFDQLPAVTFTPQSGQWSLANGTYRSGVQQTSVSLAPILAGGHPELGDTFDFTFGARLVNPYGASGNLVGIVFNYSSLRHYTEVVFSPTGVARLNRFENGVLTNIATQNYGGSRNVPFNVQMQNGPNVFEITVDGQRLFAGVTVFDVNPDQFPTGAVGLITHWAPGRFDNVRFDHGFFRRCSLTFDNPPLDRWVVTGTWNANGGTLNDTSAGQSDIVDFGCFGDRVGDNAGTNAIYHVRIRNGYGGPGNLIGLMYNYQNAESFYAGDYNEVVFSGTGDIQVNKFIQGVRYSLYSASLGLPRNAWIDLQVIRRGSIHSSIIVNGSLVANIGQDELRGGSLGVISHWAKGSFDNVSLVKNLSPPPIP